MKLAKNLLLVFASIVTFHVWAQAPQDPATKAMDVAPGAQAPSTNQNPAAGAIHADHKAQPVKLEEKSMKKSSKKHKKSAKKSKAAGKHHGKKHKKH